MEMYAERERYTKRKVYATIEEEEEKKEEEKIVTSVSKTIQKVTVTQEMVVETVVLLTETGAQFDTKALQFDKNKDAVRQFKFTNTTIVNTSIELVSYDERISVDIGERTTLKPDESKTIKMSYDSSKKRADNTAIVMFYEYREKSLMRNKVHVTFVDDESGGSGKVASECPICSKIFNKDVKNLPKECGHTGSVKRAMRLAESMETGLMNSLTDRKPTTIFGGDVDNFLKKFANPRVPGENAPTKKKNNNVRFPCNENPEHNAEVFCEWCKVDFCEKCFGLVHSSKTLSSHTKIPVSKTIQLPKCSQHPQNTAEFLCKEPKCGNSEKKMCHACLQTGHKNHRYETLTETFSKNEKQLVEMIAKVTLKESVIGKKLLEMKKMQQEYSTSSDAFKTEAKEVVDYCESKKRKMLGMLQKFVVDEAKVIGSDVEELQKEMNEATELRKRMELMLQSKTNLNSIDEVGQETSRICEKTVNENSYHPLKSVGRVLTSRSN